MPQTIRADISRTLQFGVETVFGTTVAANRRFPTLQFARPSPEVRNKRGVRPSTFKAPTSVVGGKENTTWEATSDGITFDEMVYIIESCVNTTTVATGTLSKHRIHAPNLTAQDARKSYSIEDGQVGNLWAANGAFFQGFTITSNPDGVDMSATMKAKDISIPSALTGSPTTVDNKPILIERVGVFTGTWATLDTYLVTLGAQSSGTFTLSYGGQTTPGQAFNASNTNVQTALRALTSIGGTNALVTGNAGGPYTVTITTAAGGAALLGQLTGSGASLGTPGTFAIASALQPVDNPVECELDFSRFIDAYFRIRQGERSYVERVEVLPELRVNLSVAVDQNAQTYTMTFTATGGTFTMSYGGLTIPAQTYSAAYTALTLQTALRALYSLGTAITVTGANGGPFTITLTSPPGPGPLTADVSGLTGGSATLVGGSTSYDLSGAVWSLADWRAGTIHHLRWQALTTDTIDTGIPWELTFDMNLLVGEPFELTDDQGLSIVRLPCVVAADALGNWLNIRSISKVAAL